MSEDLRKYRTLLETAHMQAMEGPDSAAPNNRLHQEAADAAQLLVDVLHKTGKEKNMTELVRDALKGYHGENAAHHDWKQFVRAVLRHADEIIQQRKAA
jgi:hypothetical protein